MGVQVLILNKVLYFKGTMTKNNISNELGSDLLNLGEMILNLVSRDAIAKGLLILDGLSPEEARTKALEFCIDLAKNENAFSYSVIDHKDTLLSEARKYLSSDKHELATVLFGTWWEHWLNGIIENRVIKQGLTHNDFKEMVKGLNNKAKSGWLLKLLNLPPLENRHLSVMNSLTEKRNQFVHYKYPAKTWEDDGSLSNDFMACLEESILYFEKYEEEHMYLSFQFK